MYKGYKGNVLGTVSVPETGYVFMLQQNTFLSDVLCKNSAHQDKAS